MKTVRKAFAAACLALAAPGISGPVRAQEPDAASLKLAVGDTVEIRVFRHDDIGGKFTLGSDGAAVLQFIGTVPLSGLTTRQATDKITKELQNGWLRRPQVTVNITEFAKNVITVTGEVRSGNSFTVARNKTVTVAQALGMAGGLTTRANPKAVLLKRGAKTYTINYKDIQNDPSLDIPLKDGDVLTVKESRL